MDFDQTCFNCGEPGHLARTCPTALAVSEQAAGAKPPWCGGCDKTTRLVDHGTYLNRCPNCHPLKWKPLAQHKRCGGCNHLIYTWDNTPCGDHTVLAA